VEISFFKLLNKKSIVYSEKKCIKEMHYAFKLFLTREYFLLNSKWEIFITNANINSKEVKPFTESYEWSNAFNSRL
jgi:hypothetical protein